jgi:hypothetical protein
MKRSGWARLSIVASFFVTGCTGPDEQRSKEILGKINVVCQRYLANVPKSWTVVPPLPPKQVEAVEGMRKVCVDLGKELSAVPEVEDLKKTFRVKRPDSA